MGAWELMLHSSIRRGNEQLGGVPEQGSAGRTSPVHFLALLWAVLTHCCQRKSLPSSTADETNCTSPSPELNYIKQ